MWWSSVLSAQELPSLFWHMVETSLWWLLPVFSRLEMLLQSNIDRSLTGWNMLFFYLLLYLKMCLLSSQEEDKEIKGVDFNILQAFHHEVRVDALAWSPESRLDRVPNIR